MRAQSAKGRPKMSSKEVSVKDIVTKVLKKEMTLKELMVKWFITLIPCKSASV